MELDSFYRTMLDSLEDGVYFVDRNRRFSFWNKAAEKITGYETAEMMGRECQDNILNHIDAEGRPLCHVGCPLFATLGDGEARADEVMLRHRDGHRIAVLVKIIPIRENGEIIGAAEVFTPRATIEEDSALVETLASKANNDALTGLPNRAYLENYLAYKMEEYKRFGNWYAVVFMDIDNFRTFNNTYGHHVGDKVLTTIAASMGGNLRNADVFGRWGGEEFLGIFAIGSAKEACIVGEKVRVLVENSEIMHEGQRLNVTASIGVAVGHLSDTPEEVVERADKLMYASKNRGKNCISVEDAQNREQVPTSVAQVGE